MCLGDILAIVGTLFLGRDLCQISSIEDEVVASIASDIFVRKQGKRLIFQKVSKGHNRITPSLLGSDLRIAPFIVFLYEHHHWVSEEFQNELSFKRFLKFNAGVDSIRIAIIGGNSSNQINNYSCSIPYDSYGTRIVELSAA